MRLIIYEDTITIINADEFKTPLNIREQNSRYRKKNKDKCRKWGKDSYHRCKNKVENIPKYLWKYAKARALRKGINFSIALDDIVIPEVCPILQVPFNKDTRRYGYSLDRKDPTKGYTPDNIWVISQIANAMKWDSTPEERKAFANWVLAAEKGM